jgi:hypothetical protein
VIYKPCDVTQEKAIQLAFEGLDHKLG